MPVIIEELIQDCKSAIQTSQRPQDFVQVAGLSTLIKRLKVEPTFLEETAAFLAPHHQSILTHISARLVPMFMKVEDSQKATEREAAWYQLYLYLSALYSISVPEVHPVHSRIEQVLIGIDEDWKNLRGYALEVFNAYPIAYDDVTTDFIRATLGEVVSDAPTVLEDKVINLYAITRLRGDVSIGSEDEVEEDDSSWGTVLDFRTQAAADPTATLFKHFTFQRFALFSIVEDAKPIQIILKGDIDATASLNGELLSAEQVADGVAWDFQEGEWQFVIEGHSYNILMKQ
jgi:hypothetical protein